MWESTAITVFALSAVAVAAAAVSEPLDRERSRAWSGGLLVGAALATLVLLPGLSKSHYIHASTAAARSGDAQAAIAQADKATRSEPWAATAIAQRALAKESAGDLQGAQSDIGVAMRKEPTNWRWPLIATRIAASRGQTELALAEYRKARRLHKYAKIFGVKSPPFR
jgi:tetratricopeptide (TPR) repeat protein